MTVAYVVIRPVVALSALGAKIGFVLGRFIGTLVRNLEPVCAVKKALGKGMCLCYLGYYNKFKSIAI